MRAICCAILALIVWQMGYRSINADHPLASGIFFLASGILVIISVILCIAGL